MTKDSPLLIAGLLWLATSAAAAAETATDVTANPASVISQADARVNENTPADAPVACEYGCEDHREGTEICINKIQHRCGKQGWRPTSQICANLPLVAE
jgi:hypothetical protein